MSELEETLAFQIRAAKLPAPETQFRFFPPRRWKADFCWPAHKLLVEVDGGTWVNGRHTRGSGFAADCQKANMAVLEGYRVLRFTGEMVESGEALVTIEKALETVSVEAMTQ